METKTYFMCAVKFEDRVCIEFRRDTMAECLERINDLLAKHGPIKYLLIDKFEDEV